MMKLLDKLVEYIPAAYLFSSVMAALIGLMSGDVLYIIASMLAYLCAKAQ